MISFVALQVTAKICCVTLSKEEKLKECDNTLGWPIINNLPKLCCTKLQFSPKNYKLTQNLEIAGVNDFSIIGNNATFTCNCSSIFIMDSINVQVENASFINCGCLINNRLLINQSAAIIFRNSSFVTIMNVAVKDSHGYAIIGENLIGKNLLENITIFCTSYNTPFNDEQQHTLGGILLYTNIIHDDVGIELFIKHCIITNITNNYIMKSKIETNAIPSDLFGSLVGLMFTQHLKAIEIQIHNLTVTKIISFNRSLLLVSMNCNRIYKFSLTLLNSIFANNKNSSHPIIQVNVIHQSNVININSKFSNNNNLTQMDNASNDSATLVLKDVKLINNSATTCLFSISGIIPILKGCTEFSNNTANILLSFGKYIWLYEESQLLIYNNKYNPKQKTLQRFLFQKTDKVSEQCPFQFNTTTTTIKITLRDNVGYYRKIYGDYMEYNCSWIENLNKEYDLTQNAYTHAMNNCGDDKYFKWSTSLFLCNVSSGFMHKGHNITPHLKYCHNKLYPGQTVSVKLIHLRYNISLYTDSDDSNEFADIAPACQLNMLKRKVLVNVVYNRCTELHYTIKSNTTSDSTCLLQLRTATRKGTDYIFKINVSRCPIGFTLDSSLGECKCDPRLQIKLTGIVCSISDMTFVLPPNGWMSKTKDSENEIIYTNRCFFDYCTLSPIKIITLDNTSSLCLHGRTGIACGKCVNGLSVVFGTSRCKECSNLGLIMIPILAVTGILIVIVLFASNLTIINGNIYGFIFFVNTLSISTLELFTTKREIAYTLILLFNLDLGIEVCFYNGMTAYVATWLQFVFPIYLLFIVAGMVVASRYIPKIERITRKKVIPVIATLYLLSYNKIMIITFRGLFSFIKIHHLSSREAKIYWPVDTTISVGELTMLCVFCGLVLVILIIPTNIILLFTKKCYRFKFVATYLKPFIDAYQASFKDDHRYFLGFELFLRALVYAVKCTNSEHIAAIYCMITILYVVYLSWHKPFKDNLCLLSYVLYILILAGVSIIFMNYAVLSTGPKEKYSMLLNLLVYLGFIETLLIAAHHWWKHHLSYCKVFIDVKKHVKMKLHRHYRFGKKSRRMPAADLSQEIHSYEEYQEELLALSPNA